MGGFTSFDDMINKVSGQSRKWLCSGSKQFNPTTTAVANECHTLFRGGGYPAADAIFDVGTNLQFQSVFDVTTNAGCLYHGGNVGSLGDDFKNLMTASCNSAATTVVPGTLFLVDVLGFYRVTTVTTTTEQATINSNTFTASNDAGQLLLTYANDWSMYQKVRFTTSGTLPGGIAINTDYWLIRISATTARVATSYANALSNISITFSTTGSGTHTLTCLLPRYSSGVGVNAIFFNPSATALGAGTPGLSLTYTNSNNVASRATPTLPSLPIGKTAASNSLILYSGATGVGKLAPFMPLQGIDTGIRSVQGIRNNASYVSGSYTVALLVLIARVPLTVLGQETMIDFTTTFPSFPQVYDGAALYWLWKSGVATPTNSLFDFDLTFGW